MAFAMLLGSCAQMKILEEVPGSQVQTILSLTIVAIWKMNQQIEDLSLSLFLCLSSLFLFYSVILPFK